MTRKGVEMKKIKKIGDFTVVEFNKKEQEFNGNYKYGVVINETGEVDWECDSLQEAVDFIRSY